MSSSTATPRRKTAAFEREPDARLVGLAKSGSEGAVRALIKRHNQRLFRVARAVARDDAEAEDVVQSAYVKAFTRLEGFRGDAEFSTWLTRIALNEAFGRARSRRPTVGLERIDGEADSAQIIQFPTLQKSPDPETEMSRKELRNVLEQAVDKLPAAFRAVFVLRDVEGMSVEEAADYLEIRPETVRTRLFRARRLMREALDAQLKDAFQSLFPFDGERCVQMADRVVAELQSRQ